MSDPAAAPLAAIDWHDARRIIRSVHPPIDLFEDIADPADWPLLIAAEQKTNPRLMETIGALDQVPPARRVSGPGASYLMAPFTHASHDRPSRFSDGAYGVLYAADAFETALAETIHHHERFMALTGEPPGWTSQFREIVLDVRLAARDLRGHPVGNGPLDRADYGAGQRLAARWRKQGDDGIVYQSVRREGGQCVALFHPDLAAHAVQGRHLDYRWNGQRVDHVRERAAGRVWAVVDRG